MATGEFECGKFQSNATKSRTLSKDREEKLEARNIQVFA